jgi:hypothetical protein
VPLTVNFISAEMQQSPDQTVPGRTTGQLSAVSCLLLKGPGAGPVGHVTSEGLHSWLDTLWMSCCT